MGGTGERSVGPLDIAGSALLVGLAGWGLLAVLERTAAQPRHIWTVVAVGVLVLSLAGPFTAATTPAAGITPAAIHLAVGAVLITLLVGPRA